ncbi:MAG: glycine cleavage system protein GcvH [Deltaproteobacteria bacterium]|nr:glycine cleavage system protein GcvH [Deltaproteobacteria bacterium]
MEFPENLLYTKEHEWLRHEDDHVVVGITDYAQDALGDIVFVELPEEGDSVVKDDAFGIIESIKAVSDIYAPISGHILEVNEALLDSPSKINEDPYHTGWMVKIKMENESELDDLLTMEEYEQFVNEERELGLDKEEEEEELDM